MKLFNKLQGKQCMTVKFQGATKLYILEDLHRKVQAENCRDFTLATFL